MKKIIFAFASIILLSCTDNNKQDKATALTADVVTSSKKKVEIDYKGLMENIIDEYSKPEISGVKSIPSIEVELFSIKTNADDIHEAKKIKDDSLQKLIIIAESKAIKYQKKRLPKLRALYAELVNKKATEEGLLAISIFNPPVNDQLLFKSFAFIQDKNRQKILSGLSTMLEDLRFHSVMFSDNEKAHAYSIESKRDDEL